MRLSGEYNPNYFNTFLDNLQNSVGDTNRNARLIDLSKVNKAHPKSFKNFMKDRFQEQILIFNKYKLQ